MSLVAGQSLVLSIDKPAAGGAMIGRAGGPVVLVRGAIPGERVTARVERIGKGVVHACAEEILEPSPDRRTSAMDVSCGGCLYSHVEYTRQLTLKGEIVADAMTRIGRLPTAAVPVTASREDGYRLRARLHMSGGRIGFFREGTHTLCDPRPTRQLLSATCDVLERVAAGLRSIGVQSGEIEVAESVDGSQRALAIDLEQPVDPRTLAFLSAEDVSGIVLVRKGAPHPTRRRGAARRSSAPTRRPRHDDDRVTALTVAGSPFVGDTIDVEGRAMELRRHVLSFFQGNRFLLQPLVTHVLRFIGDGDEVADLYAGVGLFAVSAAISRNARVTAVEGHWWAEQDLAANAASAGNVTPMHRSVEAYLAGSPPVPSIVVVDPPRTGLSSAALAGVVKLKAPQVLYISCDAPTLARDTRQLLDHGYELRRLDAFDLFPNTPHVETVAHFARA